MDYTALKAALVAYTENTSTEFDAQIPVFVTQAEQRIYNTVQFPSLRKNVTGTTTSSNKYLQCPADFLATYSMAVVDGTGAYEYLLNKDVNFIRAAYPTNAVADRATPEYYAIFDADSFILGPTPDYAYTAELHYYYYPESIVTAGTTWLGDNFDSVLLYGTICEALVYMKGEGDMVGLAQERYMQAIALYKNLGDGKQRGDAYRDGQIRIPVS